MRSGRLTLLCPVAVGAQLVALAKAFARAGGPGVATEFDLNPNIPKRILAGEDFDVGVTNPWYVGALIDSGKVDAASHAPFGRVPLAIGRLGAAGAEPVRSPGEIRALLLAAESIAYTAEGTSGTTFIAVAERLNIWQEIAPRTRPMGAGQPVSAAASGEVELAVAPLTRVIATGGLAPAAVFPPELEADIDMSMFIASGAADRDLARRLADFLADSAQDDYLASTGVSRFRFS